jgi:hypothetical protein
MSGATSEFSVASKSQRRTASWIEKKWAAARVAYKAARLLKEREARIEKLRAYGTTFV